jgi:hypothetical protein
MRLQLVEQGAACRLWLEVPRLGRRDRKLKSRDLWKARDYVRFRRHDNLLGRSVAISSASICRPSSPWYSAVVNSPVDKSRSATP